MFDLIAIGGATRDIFFEIEGLKEAKGKNLGEEILMVPYGQKLVAKETFYTYGGGALNVAISIKRLGLKTASVCNIGKEGTGSMIVKMLEQEGVNTKFINRDPSAHTGLSVFVLGGDGDHTAFLERGANNFLKIKNLSNLKRTKWFYISSLTGESAKNLPHLFNFAAKNNIRVAFNPGSRQLKEGYSVLRDYLAKTEILLVNLEEAEEMIFSKTRRHSRDKKELIRELSDLGPKIIVVTNSDQGSLAISEGEIFSQKAFSHEVVDTTGAGDAFGSTFVFGMVNGYEVADALHLAAINSASVVSKMGAQEGLLTYNEIRNSKWL